MTNSATPSAPTTTSTGKPASATEPMAKTAPIMNAGSSTPKKPAAAGAQAKAGSASARSPEARLAQRQERAKDPRSIVVAPRTQEGFLLCRIFISLDRAVYRLRREAGASIAIAEASRWLARVDELVRAVKALLARLGLADVGFTLSADGPEASAVKEALARANNAHVFLPRSAATRELAAALQRLDGALFALRLTSQDLTTVAAHLETATELVKQAHELTQALSQVVNLPYTPPNRLSKLLDVSTGAAAK